MNDEIRLFACAWWCGGLSGEKHWGSLIKTFPMEGQSRYSIFLLAVNLFDWSIITLPKKKNTLSLW